VAHHYAQRRAVDDHQEAEEQVEGADDLVVRGEDPALDEAGLVVVRVVVVGGGGMRGHCVRPFGIGQAAPAASAGSAACSGACGAAGPSPCRTSSTMSGSTERGALPSPPSGTCEGSAG